MIRFNNILDKLNVRYKREDEMSGKIISYECSYKYDYETEVPFYIIIDKKNKVFNLFSLPIKKVNKNCRAEILEEINSRNSKLAYGHFYIDDDDDLTYYCGASLEGKDNPINPEQVFDYINFMILILRKYTFESTSEVACTGRVE